MVRTATAGELVNYLSTRQIDASIIWDENYQDFKDSVELIYVPDLLDKYIKTVPVAVLSCSQQPQAAQQLADFITSFQGMAIWQKWGYRPVRQ